MKPSTLRIGYRYRPKRLAPAYDAIVIGSGMGGLTTAALLSELGWRVCVLEQHYTAGGYTHSYERQGYEWDVGVHYIGEVGTRTRTRRSSRTARAKLPRAMRRSWCPRSTSPTARWARAC